MIYLYVFDNAVVRQSSEGPTPVDCAAVKAGFMTIIRFEGGEPEEFCEPEGWEPLAKATVVTDSRGEYHL